MSKLIALIGASCEATGHPSECQEPALGDTDEGGDESVTINGTPIATHEDSMHFPDHAHAYSSDKGCYDVQSHDLVPDETPQITVNGQPVMRVGDSTTDPGSGGTAEIVDSGGNSAVSHTP